MRRMDSLFHDDNCAVAEKPAVESEKPAKRKELIWRRSRPESSRKRLSPQDILVQTVATLSHEINNPLMAITASTEILLNGNDKLPIDILEKVKQIKLAADRIQSVMEKLGEIETIHYRKTAAGRMINLG